MRAARIGVVGLGVMGSRFAGQLLDAGFPVLGTNRSQEKGAALLERGLTWCDTPREVAAAAEVVLSSVTDDAALKAVVTGADGILAGLRPATTYVDMSTVSPHLSRELAARVRAVGAEMLDAPVSGSVPQAESGSLTIMVGGAEPAFNRVEPVLAHLGSVVRVGGNGQGLLLKLTINISVAAQMVAFGEGALLVERGGIDRSTAVEVMSMSAIGSPLLRGRAPLIVEPSNTAWFDIQMLEKDLTLALDTAQRLRVLLPATAVVDELLDKSQAIGYGHRDIASIPAALAELSGRR